MPDIWVKRFGAAFIPDSPASMEVLKSFKDGQVIKFIARVGRSNKHHRLFFKAIEMAYTNWPEAHEFIPESKEHLRAWLLCKAGYRDAQTHILESAHMANIMCEIIVKSLKQAGLKGFAVYKNNCVYVLTPKSIAWGKLSQKEFNIISQRVSDVLHAEIGKGIEDFKAELDRAA